MTSPKSFRKKPVIISAMLYTGENYREIEMWSNKKVYFVFATEPFMAVDTLEGKMRVSVGDWVIRGVKGEYYPCKPDIFEATYEECELE